jgi:hypothetical protein
MKVRNPRFCSRSCSGNARRGIPHSEATKSKLSRIKKIQWRTSPRIRRMGLRFMKQARETYRKTGHHSGNSRHTRRKRRKMAV